MRKSEKITQEAKEIITKLLEINESGVKIHKYMHELVYTMVEDKKDYIDVLYEVVNMIPLGLSVSTNPMFKFDNHEEFMEKHAKYYQDSIYDK